MKAAAALLLLQACCLLSSEPKWRATAAQMSPMGPLDPHATSEIGPLALVPGAAETQHPHIQEARSRAADRYLDRARIHEETAKFLTWLDTFYGEPLSPEMRVGIQQARQLATLDRLAPYAVASVTLAFRQSTERLHLCIQEAGIAGPCDRDRKPPAAREPAFDVDQVAPGIMKLTVRDLSGAGWRDFPAAARTLADARALVLDLRLASGSDPRPLLPWIGELTGRAELRPLRAIERPASADAYVKAYADRYRDRGRDPEVWRALVGTDASTGTPTKKPIAIVVGRNCDSACELVARTLEAYAGAVVIGGVLRSGRLGRDEPAMFVLPHSQTSVYFHATRYLLAVDIEAATGPTEEWRAFAGDALEDWPSPPPSHVRYPPLDYTSWAIREVQQRLVEPAGWPRCDALTGTQDPAKISGLGVLGACHEGYHVTVDTVAPSSVLQRFLATCPTSIISRSPTVDLRSVSTSGNKADAAALSQLAASELVAHVRIECNHIPHIN